MLVDLTSRLRWAGLRLRRRAGAFDGWLPGDPLPSGAIDCALARNEHGIYCVPCSHMRRPGPRKLLRSRVPERETVRLISSIEPEADIVHAGTFLGDFLPALARSRRGRALVWAFEPSREAYRCAKATILLNDLRNVVMTNAGLAAEPGSGRLALNGGASSLIDDGSTPANSETVQLVALDEVVGAGRRVAVLHLDVEGHEQRALAGALGVVRRCLPVIIVETLPDRDWFEANLRPLGYELGERVNGNRVMRSSSGAEASRPRGERLTVAGTAPA
jgi:FkbM family methyltransferase